jgi:hypothetical protein
MFTAPKKEANVSDIHLHGQNLKRRKHHKACPNKGPGNKYLLSKWLISEKLLPRMNNFPFSKQEVAKFRGGVLGTS